MDDRVDRHIRDAMERGEFDNLPGTGKPLRFESDRLVPSEYRLAYRIMRDNDVQPEWIALQKEINTLIDTARKNLHIAVANFDRIQSALEGKTNLDSVVKRLAARDNRDDAVAVFRDRVNVINRKIALLNLKVPGSGLTRDLLDIDRELAKVFAD
ncbi:MAG TPA: DUF1992 domain-containing protein [Aggregatilineales bacterium]|nr:DUF1992 domain-containing protein [Aggregatilineales bacterium]